MKRVRIIKRVLSLLLIFLLSINSFAAVVSDNDGSAFITKAEFDALKSSFQSQIDSYNQSIDSKIDGAIASYLAGIQISTTQDYNILVDNYDEIRWMDAHKLKMQYYKYTNATTRTKTAAAYITPVYENHRNLRGAAITISDSVYGDFQNGLFRFKTVMAPNANQSKVHTHIGSYAGNTGHDQDCIPVMYIRQKKDDVSGKYYIEDLINESCIQNAMHGLIHQPYASSEYWQLSNWWPTINSWTINSPKSGAYWDYTVQWASNINMSSQMDPNNTWFGGPYGAYEPKDDTGAEATTSIDDTKGKYYYPKYWQWHATAGQFQQDLDNLHNIMLGTDDDVTVNVLNYYTTLNVCDGKFYDYSESETVTVPFYVTSAFYLGGCYTTDKDAYSKNNNKDMSNNKTKTFNIGIPLCPVKKFRTLYTGNFKDEGDNDLSIGAGLPIVKNIDKDQQITVSFDYTKVNSEYGSTTTPNNTIYVSAKKTNFETTGGSDYLTGTVNGGSLNTLNAVETTGGKAKIVIDCKKGDSVWLRIKNSASGSEPGIYTTMSNLAISGTFE